MAAATVRPPRFTSMRPRASARIQSSVPRPPRPRPYPPWRGRGVASERPCAVPCADPSCRFAHSSFEQEFHPLQLLRELAVSEAPSTLPPNDPEPVDAPAPETLGVKDRSTPRPGCKLARIHSISIYDHETLPDITCVRVTGQASKQRGNVPRSLYVAQGNNVLHLKKGSQVSSPAPDHPAGPRLQSHSLCAPPRCRVSSYRTTET